jgi:hypothetical protein
MDTDNQTKWEHFLDPEILRPNLILASIYITAFEILQNSIIQQIQDFYTIGFNENGCLPEYKEAILSKYKGPLYASLDWLKENKAINDEDIEKFNRIKDYRNLLVHELSRMLIKGLPPDITGKFKDMISLIDKIERWWIINVEIPTNPDIDGKYDEIGESKIISAPILSFKILIDIALGSNEEANFYINEYKKILRNS